MTKLNITKKLSLAIGKLHFLRTHILQILIWPMVCLGVAALLWGVVISKLNADKNFLERHTLSQVSALSKAVAKGLSLPLLEMDELSRSLQFQWEHKREIDKLDERIHGDAFLRQGLNSIGILDRHGNIVRASQPVKKDSNLADRGYFRFHQTNPTRALRIAPQLVGRTTGLPAIPFTRRLDAPDGSFDGVVVLSVRPSYLTSFYDESSFGKRGYFGVRGPNGELYAAAVGGVAVTKPMLREIPPVTGRAGIRLLRDPKWLGDDATRLVAWHQITPYPLFVVIGLHEKEVFAQYQMMAADYIKGAIAATWFLFLSAIVGTLVSMRLVWRKQQSQEIRDAYRLATEGANESFYFIRALYDETGWIIDFLIEDCNENGAAAFGKMTRDQVIGLRLSAFLAINDLVLPADIPKQIEICRKTMTAGRYEDEWEAAAASSFRGVWLHRRLVRVGDGLAVTIRDISAAKAHEKSLLSMAHEDALTKLPNRHWLMNFLPLALERARQNQSILALFFIDIDNFKQVNDTLGHAAGDALLQIAAMRLKSELRPGDSLARLGGDEFTIVLEHVDGTRDAQLVAARIVATFRQPIELDAGRAMVGTSIGISLYPADGDNIDTLFWHADIAMYAAKAAGKGQYCFYQTEQYETLMARINNQTALEHAVQQDQFIMYYQPRLSSRTGEICGIEALLRWQDPGRGMLEPKEFIGLAESTGLIISLGILVMDKVCFQIAQWAAMHLPMVPVSFNVSACEFNKGDVNHQLALCMARHHIEPESIEIELTETTVIDDKADSVSALSAIRTTGVKFLVDDFGTGYSSLSQLQRLDTDVLKIDQSFTAQLGRTAKAETFFKAILSMAHALDMGVVAEGVETLQQLQILQSLGCNELQGYYICPPVSAEEMTILLRKRFLMTPAGVLI
jgi:diguanylate cyclase (GGDEF)-like protein